MNRTTKMKRPPIKVVSSRVSHKMLLFQEITPPRQAIKKLAAKIQIIIINNYNSSNLSPRPSTSSKKSKDFPPHTTCTTGRTW
jgi:hypothetical protein